MDQAPTLQEGWACTRGSGVTVAVVDGAAGMDGHPEFEGRMLQGNPVRSHNGSEETHPHGTKVAGIALGGGPHVWGMAPEALLLPVAVPALLHGTGHPSEADGILWAADHGADIICCAWAPPSREPGAGRLPHHTRDALDRALTAGRGGKGCLILLAAGNDGGNLSHNEYAAHPGVITVGACNHVGRRPAYSDWGDALFCVFPSNDPDDPVGRGMTYLTTAPAGSFELGQTWYTRSFGFTSAACAAVAGLCALIVSASPELTGAEARDVLRASCEKVDLAGGAWNARGHSPFLGYGRPDPARAVALARTRKSASASV